MKNRTHGLSEREMELAKLLFSYSVPEFFPHTIQVQIPTELLLVQYIQKVAPSSAAPTIGARYSALIFLEICFLKNINHSYRKAKD